FTLFLVLIITQINAQYYEQPKEKPSFRDKIFFGGGLGLQFGSVTAIDVSPIVGYKITERFHAGLGFSYSYFKYNDYTPSIDFSAYSGSIFTRFFLTESLFAQAEVEALNTEVFTSFNPVDSYRKWIDSYLVGGGYFQRIGQRSGVYIMILWNLNETEFTPYSNPIMRIGFSF
ncbi:MAG: hypothetical protein HC831_16030, partial [Chloroflexia bacterium]|nr:hypothetical protein [Chloroflexia bacterium]